MQYLPSNRMPGRALPRKAPEARPGYGPHCHVAKVNFLPDSGYHATWKGQRSGEVFASPDSARAFLATCDIAGKLRY